MRRLERFLEFAYPLLRDLKSNAKCHGPLGKKIRRVGLTLEGQGDHLLGL
jgi:hypothetical protein